MLEYATVYPMVKWLPEDWEERVYRLVTDHGVDVKTKGRGPGSLEPDETAGLDYRVVGGQVIYEHASWLWDWYAGENMVELVSALVGEEVYPSRDVASAINVNYLRGDGSRYELHTDSQPYSAVMMLSNCDGISGGRLMLAREGGQEAAAMVDTKPGMLVVFDGSRIPHAVEPLRNSWVKSRTSMPMVYTPADAPARPDALDDYLYRGERG